MQLDLNELRIKLNQLTERLLSRIKDRSRYPLNYMVYKPGAIKIVSKNKLSFLEFAVEQKEKYYASLGRYNYPDQYPITKSPLPESSVDRFKPASPLADVDLAISGDILNYYLDLLKKICLDKEDKEYFGETVDCDTEILELLNERINLGRFVAEFKIRQDENIKTVLNNSKDLLDKLTYPEREKQVISNALKIAEYYQLPLNVIKELFKWIIEQTKIVEVDYLQKTYIKNP